MVAFTRFFLILGLTLVAAPLQAEGSATNKTFFLPRPPGREKFVDFASSFRVQRCADNPESERLGFSLQVTPFFRRSLKKDRLGSYFGAAGKSALTYGKVSRDSASTHADIPSENLIHQPFQFLLPYENNTPVDEISLQPAVPVARVDGNAHVTLQDLKKFSSSEGKSTANGTTTPSINGPFTYAGVRLSQYLRELETFRGSAGPAGELSLQPQSTAYGVRIGIYLNVPGLGFLRANVPLVRVENNLNLKFQDDRADVVAQFLAGDYAQAYTAVAQNTAAFDDALVRTQLIYSSNTPPIPVTPVHDTRYTIFKDPAKGAAQEALKFLKITGEKNKSEFGFGDLEVTLGQRIVDLANCDHAVFGSLVIPVADGPKGELLFEPLRGNGKHFELTAGLEGTMDLWNCKGFCFEGFYSFGMGYVFRADETRTLDVLLDGRVQFPWQRYFLTGEHDRAGALVPLANVSTLKVEVRPGFKAEGFCGLGVTQQQFSFDFGWAFWAKEAEELRLSADWAAKKYAVVNAIDYRAYEKLDLSKNSPHTSGFSNHRTIEAADLDLTSAATPTQLYQSLWGAISYNLVHNNSPVVFSLGGNYEFGNQGAIMPSWMLWAKAAIAF